MTLRRWTLTIAYVLATLVAPGLHDHGERHQVAPAALAGCAEGGVHLADHPDAPDLGHHAHHCPACQVRADHGMTAESAGRLFAVAFESAIPCPEPTFPPRPRGGPLSRAPPIV